MNFDWKMMYFHCKILIYVIKSPRFLEECLQRSVHPLPIMLQQEQKGDSTVINLAHYRMGDEIAAALAAGLNKRAVILHREIKRVFSRNPRFFAWKLLIVVSSRSTCMALARLRRLSLQITSSQVCNGFCTKSHVMDFVLKMIIWASHITQGRRI